MKFGSMARPGSFAPPSMVRSFLLAEQDPSLVLAGGRLSVFGGRSVSVSLQAGGVCHGSRVGTGPDSSVGASPGCSGPGTRRAVFSAKGATSAKIRFPSMSENPSVNHTAGRSAFTLGGGGMLVHPLQPLDPCAAKHSSRPSKLTLASIDHQRTKVLSFDQQMYKLILDLC